MKHLNKLGFLALVLISALFIGCTDADDEIDPNDPASVNFSANFGASASRDFIGQVVNESNIAIANATITIGTSVAQTDVNGVFIINNASVYEKYAYIKAVKPGFIDGSRTIVPTATKNRVKIMLVSNAPIQTVASGAASTVTLASGTQVKFDGSFQDANGAVYNGAVSVSLYHLKASNANIEEIMPGSLYAQASDGSEKILETFGMVNVELKGASGQKLNIANGHTAEISLLLDAAQMASAPATIPLWHFDETKGYWKQEGTATKVGTKYVGNVSHFSWWNCDYPNDKATLTINVVNAAGNGVSNVRVTILQAGGTFPRVGISNASGMITGIVPANLSLTIAVYNACNAIIYTTTIPGLATNSSYTLPNIVVPANAVTTFQGNLLKCNNTNVTNGYVYLNAGGATQIATITNGSFSFNTLYCGTTASNYTLIGYDYDNAQTTGVLTGIYTNPVTNVGNIIACTAISQYITYQIDGGPIQNIYSGFTAGSNSQNSNYGFSITTNGATSGTLGFFLGCQQGIGATTPGVYTTANGYVLEGTFLIGTTVINNNTTNTISFNLSNFGAIGQYINISFNGTYTVGGITRTITGSCHVLRTY